MEIVTVHSINSERKENPMTRKERIDLVLAKIPEDQRDAFIAKFREAKDREAKMAVVKEYGITFTDEEKEAFKAAPGNEISVSELDQAAGGCSCHCKSACPGMCYYYCI